jgi:hypothetical protein
MFYGLQGAKGLGESIPKKPPLGSEQELVLRSAQTHMGTLARPIAA